MEKLFKKIPEAKMDGINLKWSHRTNDPELLQKTLEDPNIYLIEADVILCSKTKQPVMAHPPADSSDFTLVQFLNMFQNFLESHLEITKGLKLDFKSLAAVEAALPMLTSANSRFS